MADVKDKKILKVEGKSDVGGKLVAMDVNKKQREELEALYKESEGFVKNFIKEKRVDEVQLDDGTAELISGMIYDRVTILYDEDKIKAALNKDQWKEVTDEMFVVSKSGLNAFTKAHPELKAELKQFITKSVHFNEKKLDVAYERGVVSLKEIDGCFRTNVTEVFKFSRKKKPKK